MTIQQLFVCLTNLSHRHVTRNFSQSQDRYLIYVPYLSVFLNKAVEKVPGIEMGIVRRELNEMNYVTFYAWAIVFKFRTEIYQGSALRLIKRDECLQHFCLY
jgi:hypothetical protein